MSDTVLKTRLAIWKTETQVVQLFLAMTPRDAPAPRIRTALTACQCLPNALQALKVMPA